MRAPTKLQGRCEPASGAARSKPRSVPTGGAPDVLSIGYLRAFVTLLVLAHHAVLAYHTIAPPQVVSLVAEPRWWQAFPVVDSARSAWVALFTGWNDIFFMALMFLLSGLFVSTSLTGRGARAFLGRRWTRLGLPFLALAGIVAPLAYYPTYLATAAPEGVGGFAREWLSLGSWPTGPGWFLWLLLAFDALAAGLFLIRPGWMASLGRALAWLTARPLAFFVGLVGLTALVYLPLASIVGPMHWTSVGPFQFQTSRLLHYAVYFIAGIALGARGFDRGLLAPGGLDRRWPLWTGAALVAYGLTVAAAIAAFGDGASDAVKTAANLGFVVTCAASSFALLALFSRFARRRKPVFDSLRDNAYGMYIVHYAIASWLQLALLPTSLPALGKAAVVTVATILLSWATTAALRQAPILRRLL